MKKSLTQIYRTFIYPGIFCIAMGVLESIVVVYLRQIYYPTGFDFPLKFFTPEMMMIEWIREIATIIMLVVLSILVGKDNLQRFLYFLFCFAIWDITYYAGLKVFLDWPSSFMTWDILFLIPVPWISPVLAPLICSITMIFFAMSFIYLKDTVSFFKIKLLEWGMILLGATLIFCSFILDYFIIITQNNFHSLSWSLSKDSDFGPMASQYIPTNFNWLLFGIGEMIILYGIISVIIRTITKNKLTYKT